MKPSSLGDIVHTLPCADILRRAFPKTCIRWLVNTEWMPLLQGNPDIDEVIEFPRRHLRGLSGLLRFLPWISVFRKRVQPDLILDFQGLLRSALISRLCHREGTRVLGLSDAREGARLFYDRVIDTRGCPHAVDRYLALTYSAVGELAKVSPPEWHLPAGEMPADFAPSEPFLILHPFARGARKSLTLHQVVEFCRGLAPRRVVIVGRAVDSLPVMSNVVDLLNRTTLLELIWLLRRAFFTVSVDSGPMHIAAALTDRLISIHTWSDPSKVGPYRDKAWVWKNGRVFTQASRDKAADSREVPDISAFAEFVKTQL